MNKLPLILLLLIASCKSLSNSEPKFNTEIVCPNSFHRFLILRSTKREVEQSIKEAIEYSLKGNKKNRYTVLRFPGGLSTSIHNMTPQKIQKECRLLEKPRKLKDI